MKLVYLSLAAGGAFAVVAGAPAQATTVNLGPSLEDLTLYGQGETYAGSGVGTFTLGQGSSTYDAATNLSTFTLSGNITSGDAGFTTGTYDFITSYSGPNAPQGGPNAPFAQSNPDNLNYFFYDYLSRTTNIDVKLNTESGNYDEQLVSNGSFVPGTGFSFTDVASTCTGVDVCTQNNVGLTPGATISSSVTTQVSFTEASAVPEPSSWAMMIGGIGMTGGALRRRRSVAKTSVAYA